MITISLQLHLTQYTCNHFYMNVQTNYIAMYIAEIFLENKFRGGKLKCEGGPGLKLTVRSRVETGLGHLGHLGHALSRSTGSDPD